MVLVNDLNARKWLLTYKFNKDDSYHIFNFRGPTIFSTADKEFHQIRKRLVAPAFSNKNLAKMEPTIYKVGSDHLAQFISSSMGDEKEVVLDMYNLFHRSTLDVIGELVFGQNLNCILDSKKADHYMNELKKTQLLIVLRTLCPSIFTLFTYPILTLFEPTILKNINARRQDPSLRNEDILQSLIDAKDPETGEQLTDVQIVDECVTLLFAGMDTTANTLTWVLYEILRHPEVYALIEKEIFTAFPNAEDVATIERCKSELPALEATILESMRLHPVAAGPMFKKVPQGGVTLNGQFIPENTSVIFHVITYHLDPNYFENPKQFSIDRWLGPNREENKGKLLTFSMGPRGCVGRDLAWSEIYLVIVKLIRMFRMELVEKEPMKPELYFLYTPKDGKFDVKLTKRV
ncbi:cytochrome P450 [Conidiobolus coronatus NRRL 28638]|uniref:Cytochrome P450 n=1 Tax=Conidiobolus coronatus (strain ATCC 28846 / CBS 209.66 / NRRL 28638) TaxID=796925 RepID=A0A137P833_CONC2|nr:cytochrome P450 [Conidiobolus coronatus NRRL 28638]|eukprot:KXN71166.1 cytochrome P450 [Conidiobolus coronatus NRRL 28638]